MAGTWGDDTLAPGMPMAQELWHAEQERKSHDIIRIGNPTDKDFFIQWGHPPKFFKVPAQGTLDVDRYLAEAYWRDMTVQMINEMGQKLGEELLERVGKQKPDVLLDEYLKQKEVWDKVPRTNDEKLLLELTPKLWLGLIRKHGLDIPQSDSKYADVDLRTTQEKVLGDFENKVVDSFDAAPPIQEPVQPEKPPVYVSKADLAKEVLSDAG